MSDYYEALFEERWKQKREEILQRDNHRCAICNRSRTVMVECEEEMMRPKQTLYLGIDFSEGRKIRNWLIATCTREQLKNGKVVLFGGKAVTAILPDGKRYVLIGRTYLLPCNFQDVENFKDETLEYGLMYCVDGSLQPVAFTNPLIPFAPFDDDYTYRPYLSKEPVELHVHHKYYVDGRKPWDYPNDALITLCSECHEKLHRGRLAEVPVYTCDLQGVYIKKNYTPCQRCHGQGYLKEYLYYQGGICFRCHGRKFEELIPSVEK